MMNEIVRYGGIILFLVPLGVIGIWRWSVWLLKKVISFFYRTPKGNFYSTLSIVTPVYNEDPEMFRLALDSWKLNEPDEIIAVVDYSNPELVKIFENFARGFDGGTKLIVTKKPGKRPALADGVKVSNGEIIALVDSDTIWGPNIKGRLLAPFSDPQVGGLSTRQDILETNTLARKLFKIMLDDKYLVEYPFLSTVSSAMLCLSGRTAVYRRVAIEDKMDALVNETFWGERMISGDDKTLTNLVHAAGWKTRFLKNVKVYTPGNAELGSFLKQKLRWARNGVRSDSRVLLSGWVWRRHKILAIFMIDKFISAITILLAPVYFAVSLYYGYWQVALIIFIWWMVSRTIKIFPHLREKPLDIFLLPLYVVMTFVMALIKIYAFFTLDTQGWITRWDASRLKGRSNIRQIISVFLALCFIGGYFFAIGSYHHKILLASQEKSLLPKEHRAPVSIISQAPRNVSDAQLAAAKQSILDFKTAGAYGYYVMRPGDTLLGLQREYNLTSINSITYPNNVPIANPNSISVGAKVMIPVSDMRNTLDAATLLGSPEARFVPSLILYIPATNTISVKGGGSVVTLTKIKQALGPNSKALQQLAPGQWILRANLYISKNVTLVLDKTDVSYLKMKSDPTGFVTIRSQRGNILISNTRITSWDESANAPDTNLDDGRAYVTAKASGRMDVVDSEIAYLGYVGYLPTDTVKKRGGQFGGSYGLSWKITSGAINSDLLTGSVVNSNVHDNYFGMYSFGATALLIKNNDVHNDVNYGIDPHDDSNNLIITGNRTYDNGNHGIILSKRCINNEISDNISYGNRLHGIMLDKNSSNNIVTGNTVYGNVDGIAVDTSSNFNLIANNTSYDNKQGIRINTSASNNYVQSNQIYSNATGIHLYAGANNNIVLSNAVHTNKLGVSIQTATGNALYGNFKPLDNTKDGSVRTDPSQNEIKL